MKQRTTIYLFLLTVSLFPLSGWGQTQIVTRQSSRQVKPKEDAKEVARRKRLAQERAEERDRIEQERAREEKERQRLARIAELDRQDAPAVARGELVVPTDSFKYYSEIRYDCITYSILIKDGHGIIRERNEEVYPSRPSGHISIPGRVRIGESYYPITEISYAFGRPSIYSSDGSQLTSVTLPSSIKGIYFGAFENTALQSVNLPEGLLYLGDYALSGEVFKDCKQLQSIKLPQSLLRIGDHCFEGSGIKEIRIPKNVRHIGNKIFYKCKELASVYFEGTPDTIWTQPFLYCDNLKEVSVPKEFYERYKNDHSLFGNCPIKEFIVRNPDGTTTLVARREW